jgi:hypothetical protein
MVCRQFDTFNAAIEVAGLTPRQAPSRQCANLSAQTRASAPSSVSDSLETTIRELVDRQQITACLHRYTRGCDRIDADLIRSAFHPDAIDYHGPVTGSVDDFLAYWRPLQDAREVSQHPACGNGRSAHLHRLDG